MPPTPGRIVPMEGLRGVAALMVLLVHFHTLFIQFAGPPGWVQPVSLFLSTIGHTGVDLFFVLSGYLMYGVILRDSFHFGPFLVRRLRRLYPVFLAVFLLYVGLSYAFPDKSKLPSGGWDLTLYLGANLLMLPGLFPIVPMITQAWSLSYEWFFYLAAPAVVDITRMRQQSPMTRLLMLAGLAIGYLALCSLGYGVHPRLTMFLAGCLLWESVRSGRITRFLTGWGEYVALAAFLANLGLIGWIVADPARPMAVFHVSPGSYTGIFFLTSFWFVAYALFYNGRLARLFSLDPLRQMGNISYSYYLVHGVVLHGVQRIIVSFGQPLLAPSPGLYLLLFLITLAATVAAGAVFYLLFEEPFQRSAANEVQTSGRPGYHDIDGVRSPES